MQRFLVKKLSERATLPTRQTRMAAGYDLSSAMDIIVPARGKAIVNTDIAVVIPDGHYGRIAPRSSLAVIYNIGVGAGVIDADFRGNICVVLFNHGSNDVKIYQGDRIAQLILEKISTPDVEEIADVELPVTARGSGGFGSTGR